jgi:hypothetical protein
VPPPALESSLAEEEPLLGLNLRSKAKKESKTSQTQEEFKNKEA